MQFKSITAVSALALMISLPVYAAELSATSGTSASTYSSQENTVSNNVKDGLRDADKSMRETADEIRAFFIGKGVDEKLTPVVIHRSKTAYGLIGETVVNSKGEKIATVKDIIMGKGGKALLVVVSDGGLLGIGDKVAAFDYSRVVMQKSNGKVVMSLSQDMVDRAADFSYDQGDWTKAKVIPTGSVSVSELLKGDVLNAEGEKVAAIENVYFRDADASQIIVGFNKTLGMGGDLAALDYDDVQMIKKDGGLDFKLTVAQSVQFKNFQTRTAEANSSSYPDDIKAFFVGRNANDKLTPVVIRRSMTANGLVGETIVNPKGEKVGTVKDIIIDKAGKAVLVVVSDGGLLGLGNKLAAFNYSRVVSQKADGKVVMMLTQDMVDNAKDFSYDLNDEMKAKVIPAGSISVNELLKGDVYASGGDKVASIENVYLRNAEVSQIIVGFNKTLGIGGDLAALDYDDVQMVKKSGDELDFKLTANQSAEFKSFKKSMAN